MSEEEKMTASELEKRWRERGLLDQEVLRAFIEKMASELKREYKEVELPDGARVRLLSSEPDDPIKGI